MASCDPIFLLAEVDELIAEIKAAYKAALTGIEYEIRDRRLKRMSPANLKKELDRWVKYKCDLEAGRNPDRMGIGVKRGRMVR